MLNNEWADLTDTNTPIMRGHSAVWDPDNTAVLIFGGQHGEVCRAFSVYILILQYYIHTYIHACMHACTHTHTLTMVICRDARG